MLVLKETCVDLYHIDLDFSAARARHICLWHPLWHLFNFSETSRVVIVLLVLLHLEKNMLVSPWVYFVRLGIVCTKLKIVNKVVLK